MRCLSKFVLMLARSISGSIVSSRLRRMTLPPAAHGGTSGVNAAADFDHLIHGADRESKVLPDVAVERHLQARHGLRLEVQATTHSPGMFPR